MEVIVDGQGIVFYRIPRGTTLFRGDSDEYFYKQKVMRLQNRPTFFGLEQGNVEENYGIAYEFVTLVELNLIALDKNQGTAFYNLLPPEYKLILDINYGYQTGTRDSVSEQDKKILAYICENGYDGYACGPMTTKMGGTFHSEVALCSPVDKLGGGQCVTDRKTAEDKIYQLNSRRFAPVKTKTVLRRTESPPKSLFGFGSPSQPARLGRDLFDSPLSSGNIMENPSSPGFGILSATFSSPSQPARLGKGLLGTPSPSGNINYSSPLPDATFSSPLPSARLDNSLFRSPSPSARLDNGLFRSPSPSARLDKELFGSSSPRSFSTEDKENFLGGMRKSTFRKSGAKTYKGKIGKKTKRNQKKRRTQRSKKIKK